MARQEADEGTFFYVLNDATHILFVDDDPIMREFGAVHLSTDTAQVKLAGDGVEALEAIAADRPDIVLLDLEMPRLDGFEVLQRLRADPATRDLPVIVVTGREDVAAIDRAFDCGATSFLVKPINWRLLSYQIRYVLRAGRSDAAHLSSSANSDRVPEGNPVALVRLAQDGASLIRLAMGAGPDLKCAAIRYADRLTRAMEPAAATARPDRLHG